MSSQQEDSQHNEGAAPVAEDDRATQPRRAKEVLQQDQGAEPPAHAGRHRALQVP